VQLPLTHSDAVCGVQNATKQCISRYHLHTKPVLSAISTHSNPVGLSLETWLACVTDDLQWTKPWADLQWTKPWAVDVWHIS
jgi:hypothetical protein